jgi:hypothetical protein
MNSVLLSVSLTATFLLAPWAWAAPFPGTSSSRLMTQKPGLFYSTRGFSLNSAQTSWVQIAPPKHIPSLVTVYRSPVRVNGQQSALTVRVDDLRKAESLKLYVRHWMKDYPRFGFEVLTAKSIKINDNPAFLLDIVSRETQKQLRQLVFVKDKTAVILTCRDGRESFAKTVLDCNEIMKTFAWVKPN